MLLFLVNFAKPYNGKIKMHYIFLHGGSKFFKLEQSLYNNVFS
jgi:hypothetical protein